MPSPRIDQAQVGDLIIVSQIAKFKESAEQHYLRTLNTSQSIFIALEPKQPNRNNITFAP